MTGPGSDFGYWQSSPKVSGVHFLSRVKENMVCEWTSSGLRDRTDARTHGVTEDRRVPTRAGHALRIVGDTKPVSGECFEFLTTVMELPPGVSEEFYQRRWEAEKGVRRDQEQVGREESAGDKSGGQGDAGAVDRHHA